MKIDWKIFSISHFQSQSSLKTQICSESFRDETTKEYSRLGVAMINQYESAGKAAHICWHHSIMWSSNCFSLLWVPIKVPQSRTPDLKSTYLEHKRVVHWCLNSIDQVFSKQSYISCNTGTWVKVVISLRCLSHKFISLMAEL